jgi:hypothetical protein
VGAWLESGRASESRSTEQSMVFIVLRESTIAAP